MDKHTFKNLLDEAERHLQADRLQPALTVMESLAGLLADWDCTSRLNNIQRGYSALLTYFRSGSEDEGRAEMYQNFLRELDEVWCELHRKYLVEYTETAYAKTVRVLQHLPHTYSNADLFNESDLQPTTVFETVWTSELFTESVAALCRSYFEDMEADSFRKRIVVSALTLAALEVFDPIKLRLLISLSRNEDDVIRARAMAGVVFVFFIHRQRISRYPDLSAAIDVEYEEPSARRELVELQMQLILSMETKQLARSLREEILPEVLRKTKGMVPDNEEDLTSLGTEMAELSLNPDWEQDSRRSEVGKKIRRLIEMQQKGADVYLSSFAMLKGRFPFFRQASNWFMPFDSTLPELNLNGNKKDLADKMANIGMLCDSDKYSMALLISQMPEEQFDMIRTQIESMAMPAEIELDAATEGFTAALRTTLQDFYRFATLFNHGDKALNPFRGMKLLTSLPPFSNLIGHGDELQQIATFAFEEGNYAVALPLITALLKDNPSARLWQMAGYCHQRAGAFAEAVKAYDNSGLFGEHSAWTIRQLAACHRAAGQYEEALAYYEQMAETNPDDISLLVRRAQCLQEIGRTQEALDLLHKADYLEEQPAEGTRALLHALFYACKFDSALNAGRRLLNAEPQTSDRRLTAHAAWLSGNVKDAIALYKSYYSCLTDEEKSSQQAEELLFGEEREHLLENGKTQVDLQIMADATSEMQD